VTGADRSYPLPLQREPTARPGRIRTTWQDKRRVLARENLSFY